MNKLTMAAAIAITALIAPIGALPASAVDAHHPGKAATQKAAPAQAKSTPATKRAKKAKKPASGMMMNCPMMAGGQTGQGGMMNCPMMAGGNMMSGGAGMDAGMTAGSGRMMRGRPMTSGGMMGGGMMGGGGMMQGRGPMGQCWVATDRDRGYGYWGGC